MRRDAGGRAAPLRGPVPRLPFAHPAIVATTLRRAAVSGCVLKVPVGGTRLFRSGMHVSENANHSQCGIVCSGGKRSAALQQDACIAKLVRISRNRNLMVAVAGPHSRARRERQRRVFRRSRSPVPGSCRSPNPVTTAGRLPGRVEAAPRMTGSHYESRAPHAPRRRCDTDPRHWLLASAVRREGARGSRARASWSSACRTARSARRHCLPGTGGHAYDRTRHARARAPRERVRAGCRARLASGKGASRCAHDTGAIGVAESGTGRVSTRRPSRWPTRRNMSAARSTRTIPARQARRGFVPTPLPARPT